MKNKDFVLIGQGKPCVIMTTGDSHHPSPPLFGSNIGFWVHPFLFEQLQRFEKPLEEEIAELGPEKAKAAQEEVHAMVASGEMFNPGAKEKMEATAVGQIIKNKLEVSKGKQMLWQFSGITDRDPYIDNPNFVRSVAMFGERGLVEWTFIDRNIKFYFYLLQAKVLNFFAQKFVYKNWEPGQWPVPWADKGEFPIQVPQAEQKNEELVKNLKDLEERLKKAGGPDGAPRQDN